LELPVNDGNREITSALIPLLEDPSRNVRVATAWILKSTVDLQSRAGRELQTALDLNADQPIGQYQKAMLFLSRHQPDKALEHFQRAVKLDSLAPWLRVALADVLSQQQRYPEAVLHLQAACKVSPQNAEYHYKLAVALAKSNRPQESRAAATQALQIDPNFKAARDMLN